MEGARFAAAETVVRTDAAAAGAALAAPAAALVARTQRMTIRVLGRHQDFRCCWWLLTRGEEGGGGGKGVFPKTLHSDEIQWISKLSLGVTTVFFSSEMG